MSEMKYENIATISRSEVDLIKSALEAEGIDVQVFQESVLSSGYSTELHPVQIFVPKAKARLARTLLRSLEKKLKGGITN